jgi:hypothetical protein
MFVEQDAQGETSSYPPSPSVTPQPTQNSRPDPTTGAVSPTSSNDGAAGVAEGGSAVAGLVVALVAAAALF